ncbi:sulfotransferase family 2 domain-containing protein [bacterium]|nr:sulfotransferase family 2 domain-containing protein [bacterium]
MIIGLIIMSAYVVIRVPKCGSTSIARMMTSSMPNSKVFDISSADFDLPKGENQYIERLRIHKNKIKSNWRIHKRLTFDAVWNKTNRLIKDNDIILGHLTIDSIKLVGIDKKPITVIRDPLERILSDYNYCRSSYNKNGGASKFYRTKNYAAGNYSLEGYVSYLKENRPVYGRYISRFVLGENKVDDPVKFLEQTYFSYGVLERMDLFVDDFYKKSGLSLIQKHANKTNSRAVTEIPDSARKSIIEFCEEDIHLYQSVRKAIEK